MRISILPFVAMATSLVAVSAQFQGAAPGIARIQNMMASAVGDMSSVASRLRNGFSRTFGSSSRRSNFRPNQASRNSPPIDPAIHTNEIAPSRQLDEDAPNAPGFGGQGVRRPPPRGGPAFSFRRLMDQMMGGMRSMLQGFNRRGGGPGRRVAQQKQLPAGQQSPVGQQQSSHFQHHSSAPQEHNIH
ncbi:uncharacterized protein LOC108680487 [Hyalella azteca]|uniref:Uncharacterized protein LOC108680487 n=1 Tax=Hyalella azteca TaxID=294128 RepID=A0A8B7PHK1_HYAAZ|nr:uncharacterized protein LOC108680487 [Hyalella azteca]